MTTAIGRNTKLEIALTMAAAKTVTALTQASPGVATSAAHGMANGTVGFWTPTGGGMPQIDGQATRVYNQATNTFETQGLNTTPYSPWVTGGLFTPAATWGTLAEAIAFSSGGGAVDDLDDSRLMGVVKEILPGLLPPDTMQVDILSQTFNSAVMQFLDDASISLAYVLGRITLHDGSVRVFRGIPSRASESLTRGQLATGSLQFKVKGLVLKGAA